MESLLNRLLAEERGKKAPPGPQEPTRISVVVRRRRRDGSYYLRDEDNFGVLPRKIQPVAWEVREPVTHELVLAYLFFGENLDSVKLWIVEETLRSRGYHAKPHAFDVQRSFHRFLQLPLDFSEHEDSDG